MDVAELSRRAVLKRTALAGLGAMSVPLWVRALIAGSGLTGHPPRTDAWRPAILDEHQNATVIAICERIIPQTDTAGAASVHVNRFIDAVLADAAPEVRGSFLSGLAWIDERARELHGAAFIAIAGVRQTDLLASMEASRHAFFTAIKSLTIRGYYTSEAALREAW